MSNWSTPRVLTVVGIAVVVVIAVVWLSRGPKPPAIPGPVAPKKIEVEYVGGSDCVHLDVPNPEIWQDRAQNAGKPKKVKWVVKKAQEKEYTWQFEYSPQGQGKPVGIADYLGPVSPIACSGPQNTQSGMAPKDQGQDVSWPYKITVSDCVDGEPGEELCVLDPVIWIRQ